MFKNFVSMHHAKFLLALVLGLIVFAMPHGQGQQDTMGNQAGFVDVPFTNEALIAKKSFDIGSSLKQAATHIQKSFEKIRQDGKDVANNSGIRKLATIFAFFFGTIALALPAFRIVMGAGESAIEEFVSALLVVGIFVGFMQAGNYSKLVSALASMMTDLANALFTNGKDPVDQIADIVKATIDGFLQNLPTGLGDFAMNVGYFIMIIVMGLAAILAMIVALFFIMIYINIGNVLMAIAMALGPIFVACGVWKVTRTYFDKWLNFLIIAGFYEIVSKLLLVLIAKTALLTKLDTAGSAMIAQANVFFALMTLATLAYMASLIPDIVNALLPGQIGGVSGAGGTARKLVMKAATPAKG